MKTLNTTASDCLKVQVHYQVDEYKDSEVIVIYKVDSDGLDVTDFMNSSDMARFEREIRGK